MKTLGLIRKCFDFNQVWYSAPVDVGSSGLSVRNWSRTLFILLTVISPSFIILSTISSSFCFPDGWTVGYIFIFILSKYGLLKYLNNFGGWNMCTMTVIFYFILMYCTSCLFVSDREVIFFQSHFLTPSTCSRISTDGSPSSLSLCWLLPVFHVSLVLELLIWKKQLVIFRLHQVSSRSL